MALWLIRFSLVVLVFAQRGLTQKEDLSKSGRYLIRSCNAGQAGSLESKLQTLLPQIYDQLQVVIDDAAQGNASQHGFEAFFSDQRNVRLVQDTFKKIAKGDPILTDETGSTKSWYLPTILCVQDGDPDTHLLQDACRDNDFTVGVNNQYAVLCPKFWHYKTTPTSYTCPRVRWNVLNPNTAALIQTQEAYLVHAFALMQGISPHSRLPAGFVGSDLKVRDAFGLSERDALKSAANFAYYYSAVRANCTQWPDRTLPPYTAEGRELLEADQPTVPDLDSSTMPQFSASFDAAVGFCQDAVSAPNASVCCNMTSGQWEPAPAKVDLSNPACAT